MRGDVQRYQVCSSQSSQLDAAILRLDLGPSGYLYISALVNWALLGRVFTSCVCRPGLAGALYLLASVLNFNVPKMSPSGLTGTSIIKKFANPRFAISICHTIHTWQSGRHRGFPSTADVAY